MGNSKTIIGVVGPCSAGKTTLITELSQHGFSAKHIAQEHSYVKDMWQRIGKPDILVYLDVSYEQSMKRRPLNMSALEFEEQKQRLVHARQHAECYLDTTALTPQEVFAYVEGFLGNSQAQAHG